MRKDVKVGLASGGVLLAVIIVYVSSLNKPARTTQPGATLITTGAVESSAPKRTAPAVTVAVDNSAVETPTDESPKTTVVPSTPVASANNPNEPDWARLLDTGAPPALMTSTPAEKTTEKAHAASSVGVAVEKPASDVFADTSATAGSAGSTSVAATVVEAPPVAMASTPSVAKQTDRTVTAAPTGKWTGTYTIKSGESFYTIARDVYGNSHFYPHLLRANPDIDPGKLQVGMKINLPDPATVKPANPVIRPTDTVVTAGTTAGTTSTKTKPTAGTTAVALKSDEYRIASNDNLYRISNKVFGDAKHVDAIYDLNKATIGDDPAKLKVGMVLKMPAK